MSPQEEEIKDFYKKQISFTEWLEAVSHPDTAAFRVEDNEKRERLKILNRITGLPFDRPEQFSAVDISEKTPEFVRFYEERSEDLWALRLIPKSMDLPKLRIRGLRPKELVDWFNEQEIDPRQYRADFVPHSANSLWSATFVVNSIGIHGEIIRGGHSQLTQGFHEEGSVPITFSFDFKDWRISLPDSEALAKCKDMVKHLHVPGIREQEALCGELEAEFTQDYLRGYFEAVESEEYGMWFIDYNRVLGAIYKDFSVFPQIPEDGSARVLKGQTGYAGRAKGRANIVLRNLLSSSSIEKGEILVCEMTTPEHIFLMKAAGAIVTDFGGILSHAAIVARELKKPCVVGTGNATKVIRQGDEVEVNADRGLVTIS